MNYKVIFSLIVLFCSFSSIGFEDLDKAAWRCDNTNNCIQTYYKRAKILPRLIPEVLVNNKIQTQEQLGDYSIDRTNPYVINLESFFTFNLIGIEQLYGELTKKPFFDEFDHLSALYYHVGVGASGPNLIVVIYDLEGEFLGSLFAEAI